MTTIARSDVQTTEQEETITAVDLYAMPDHGGRQELVRGEIVPMSPASTYHGKIVMRIVRHLANHVAENELGEVYAAETGFKLAKDPDTVRAPDVAFVAGERIPPEGEPETGFWAIAPDLVVEVISPHDAASAVQDKVVDYLDAGGRLVWLLDPQARTVTEYAALDQIRVLRTGETLGGGEVLPGFALPLSTLFR